MCDSNNDPNKNPIYLEWEKCQDAVTAFDKMILDIRKYGFTFITLLLTANGFLLGKENINEFIALGILAVLLILIVALFRIDRMHEVFVRAVVLRAMRLEEKLEFGLTRCISYWSESSITATWGTVVYALFCFAAFILTTAAIYKDALEPKNQVESPAISTPGIDADQLSKSLNELLEKTNLRVLVINADPESEKNGIDNKQGSRQATSTSDSTLLSTSCDILKVLMKRPVFWISCVVFFISLAYIIIYNMRTRLKEKPDSKIRLDPDNPFRAHITGIEDLWKKPE